MKFNIGDIVIGNDKNVNVYGITTKGWIGKVVGYQGTNWGEEGITVTEIEGGIPLIVESKYFDLYQPIEPDIDDEFVSMMFTA